MKNKTVLYVASSLPIMIIKSNLDKWNVNEIILANNIHYETYKYLLNHRNDIKITKSPNNFFKNFVFLFKKLLCLKISNREIIFFHECCCTLFDLILNFLNTKAEFYPHVTLDSLVKINSSQVHFRNKEKILITAFFQINKFNPWKLNKDNNSGFDIVWSCNHYNTNIKTFDIEATKEYRNSKPNLKDIVKNKVLLLTSRDFCNDNDLINLYLKFISFLKENNINYLIKDHPNYTSRLNLPNIANENLISPEIPNELIIDDFQHVIGLCSSGLIYYSNRSISLLYLINEDIELLEQRKSHLINIPGGDKIAFPRNLKELYDFFT